MILIGIALSVVSVILAAYGIASLQSPSVPKKGGIEDLTFTVQTDKGAYAPGEEVHIVTNLTNVGTASVTLSQGDSCGAAVSIWYANGTPLFSNRDNQPCFQVIVEFTIAPGTSLVESYVWDQKDYTGHPVPEDHWYEVRVAAGVIADTNQVKLGDAWFFIGSPT